MCEFCVFFRFLVCDFVDIVCIRGYKDSLTKQTILDRLKSSNIIAVADGVIMVMQMYCILFMFVIVPGGLLYLFRENLSYMDYDIITKFVSGIAPCMAALIAYYKWYTNRDYKNEYYKKILDVRICAYEELRKLLSLIDQRKEIRLTDTDGTDIKRQYHHIFHNDDELEKAVQQITRAVQYNSWMYYRTVKILYRLNILIISARDYLTKKDQGGIFEQTSNLERKKCSLEKIVPNQECLKKKEWSIDRQYVIIGICLYDEVRNLCDEIRRNINKDMLELHKVEEFLRELENTKNKKNC